MRPTGPLITAASLQIPSNPEAPILIEFGVHALNVGLVNRHTKITKNWATTGVYALVGTIDDDKGTAIYVGKAADLRSRIGEHRRKPPLDWQRAVLVSRDTTNGFNTSEIGYLEGRWAGQVAESEGTKLIAGKRDIDKSLPDVQLIQLDEFIPTLMSSLRLVGVNAAPQEDEEQEDKSDKQKTYYGVTVADLLSSGLLSVGQEIVFKRMDKSVSGQINADGQIVVDGRAANSPSRAGRIAHSDLKTNPPGWDVWITKDGESLAALREQYIAERGGAVKNPSH